MMIVTKHTRNTLVSVVCSCPLLYLLTEIIDAMIHLNVIICSTMQVAFFFFRRRSEVYCAPSD